MISIKNKKISLSILLVSIVLIIFFSIIKVGKKTYTYDGPITRWKVEKIIKFLGIELSYNNTLFYLFISVIFSILALIFLDENTIAEKSSQLYRRIYSEKENKQKIINFLKGYSKKIFIVILAIIVYLLFVNKCNKTKHFTVKETSQETSQETIFEAIDAPIKIDSTQNNKTLPNQETVPENKQNTVNHLSAEDIHELVNSLPTARAIQEGKKFVPAGAGTGVINLGEGVDTEQLQQLSGNGGTLNTSTLEAAKTYQSSRNKH